MIIATRTFAMGYLYRLAKCLITLLVQLLLQLMHFSVYFKGILNTDHGYFHI